MNMRQYRLVDTREIVYLDYDSYSGRHRLRDSRYQTLDIPFYAAGHTAVDLRLLDCSVVSVPLGEVYRIDPGNPPTHKKYFYEKRFRKI